MENAPHVLVVDDDTRLLGLLRRYLTDNGFVVATAADAADARAKLAVLSIDLVVLDVMMPGEDGMSLTRFIRGEQGPPVLLLTAMSEVESRIKGLECGADDYLTKPFEPRELLLRIGAVLRRHPVAEPQTDGTELIFGDFVWNKTRLELTRNGEPVHLTSAETQALTLLAEAAGEVVGREELARHTGGSPDGRATDVLITRLRRKIEGDSRQPRHLQTLRGQGYRLRAG